MLKVAIYGKGGIGKSTITSNLAAAFAAPLSARFHPPGSLEVRCAV